MSDPDTPAAAPPEAPVPAQCRATKTELDKCVKEKAAEACKELMEAFRSCLEAAQKKA